MFLLLFLIELFVLVHVVVVMLLWIQKAGGFAFVFLRKHNHTTHHLWQYVFMIKCMCVSSLCVKKMTSLSAIDTCNCVCVAHFRFCSQVCKCWPHRRALVRGECVPRNF